MTTKYGQFLERPYIVGRDAPPVGTDEATGTRHKIEFDPSGNGNRDKGLSLKATAPKSGKGNDACFEKFKTTARGDKYVDTRRQFLQAKKAEAEKNVGDAFKSSGPMKKSTGPGDFYGTCGGKVAYMPHGNAVARKKGEIPEGLPQIYTSPAKKGSFGMNKYTLSERQGYKGVVTEYEYLHDPLPDKATRFNAIMEERKKVVSDTAFRPSAPGKKGSYGVPNTTISKGKGVAGEYEYIVGRDAGPPTKDGEGGEGGEGSKPEPKPEMEPFVPANSHVAKRVNHIPYYHDPEGPKAAAARARKLALSRVIADKGDWRPNHSGNKTDMVRSVVKMNIPRRF